MGAPAGGRPAVQAGLPQLHAHPNAAQADAAGGGTQRHWLEAAAIVLDYQHQLRALLLEHYPQLGGALGVLEGGGQQLLANAVEGQPLGQGQGLAVP